MKDICNKKVLLYNKKYDNAGYLCIRKNKTLAFRVRSLKLLQYTVRLRYIPSFKHVSLNIV